MNRVLYKITSGGSCFLENAISSLGKEISLKEEMLFNNDCDGDLERMQSVYELKEEIESLKDARVKMHSILCDYKSVKDIDSDFSRLCDQYS